MDNSNRPNLGNANVTLSATELTALEFVLADVLGGDDRALAARPELRTAAVRARAKIQKALATGVARPGPQR